MRAVLRGCGGGARRRVAEYEAAMDRGRHALVADERKQRESEGVCGMWTDGMCGEGGLELICGWKLEGVSGGGGCGHERINLFVA
jgi:hypothetical protein